VADWTTISALATAGGTLVLAAATFASVRSANRAARATERALLAGIRPLLVPTRLDDPPEKVGFQDDVYVHVEGGRAAIRRVDGNIYMAISLRNAGNGIAVLDRWDIYPERLTGTSTYRSFDSFRRLTRDIYIPGGDRGFWQGAFRDQDDPRFAEVADAIERRSPLTIDLLYSDSEGGQHAVSRFGVLPFGDDGWLAAIGRHWNIDRDDPR
jgi:hypothetical protein